MKKGKMSSPPKGMHGPGIGKMMEAKDAMMPKMPPKGMMPKIGKKK